MVRTFIELDGEDVSTRQVAEHARANQYLGVQALDIYQRQLAEALSVLINIVDPEAIVLSGGLSNIETLYREVPNLWLKSVFSDQVSTRLLPPVHGDSSGVRGGGTIVGLVIINGSFWG